MKYNLEFAILTNKYAGGNRTVKQSGGSMHLHVDSEHTAGATATEGFSLYVGPWMTVNQDHRYTKHIYAGSRRIVSKVGDVSSFSSSANDPRGVPYVGKDEATGVDSIGTRARYAAQTARVGGLYAKFGVPYGGRDNNVYLDEMPEPAPERSAGSLPAGESGRFFHHPDHLGSSSRVTDRNGKVVQAVEYVPFGEVFLDLRNSDWSTPYLFNAKEFDGETGLYYYGARYYDPRLCLWLSTDPMQEKYPALSPYCYTKCNPVNAVDPDGNVVIFINGQHAGDGGSVAYWGKDLISSILRRIGDYKTIYYDGACGGWNNTLQGIKCAVNANGTAYLGFESQSTNLEISQRFTAGKDLGYRDAGKIIGSLTGNETIKFVSHSMGGAYTKGFIEGLQSYANEYNFKNHDNKIDISKLIEYEIDFAPYQPNNQHPIEGIQTIVIQHKYDRIAGIGQMPNAQTYITHQNMSWLKSLIKGFSEHSISSFSDDVPIFVPKSRGRGTN